MSPKSRTLYGGQHAWPTMRPVNDTIRGGRSTSHWQVNQGNVAHFSGNLDTEALGGAGFASQAAAFDPVLCLPRDDYAALALTVRLPSSYTASHQPTSFVLVLKDERAATRPDGRRESILTWEFAWDMAQFFKDEPSETKDPEKQARSDAVLVARWSDFKPIYRGRPTHSDRPIQPAHTHELSFMCRSNFDQQKGPFALDIVSLAALAIDDKAVLALREQTLPATWWTKLVNWFSVSWNWIHQLCTGERRGVRLE